MDGVCVRGLFGGAHRAWYSGWVVPGAGGNLWSLSCKDVGTVKRNVFDRWTAILDSANSPRSRREILVRVVFSHGEVSDG
jgi:hypothetical protein